MRMRLLTMAAAVFLFAGNVGLAQEPSPGCGLCRIVLPHTGNPADETNMRTHPGASLGGPFMVRDEGSGEETDSDQIFFGDEAVSSRTLTLHLDEVVPFGNAAPNDVLRTEIDRIDYISYQLTLRDPRSAQFIECINILLDSECFGLPIGCDDERSSVHKGYLVLATPVNGSIHSVRIEIVTSVDRPGARDRGTDMVDLSRSRITLGTFEN